MQQFLETTADQATRLDQLWAARLEGEGITRNRVQDWIKAGLAAVDGQICRKPSLKLRGGERLELTIPEAAEGGPLPEALGLRVIHADEHLLVIDKPPGLTVHPAPSCPEGTLVNRLVHHFPELADIEGERPGIVHRIDKDTSGLLLVARSEYVRLKLAQAFADRTVSKTYLALVHGKPKKDQATIDAAIGRDPERKTRMKVVKGAKEALSSYQTVWTSPDGAASLVEVAIATGRTHQIRVHMAHIGHPLLGDALYGPAQHADMVRGRPAWKKLLRRQMLHAWRLGFTHPQTGEELTFELPPPKDFWRVPLLLGRKTQRVGIVGLPGSGKSAALAAFAQGGDPAWSADACVAQLYMPGEDGWVMLSRRFGTRFIAADDAPVDKTALLAAMRANDGLRREVMDMLYPLAMHRLNRFWQEHKRARVGFAEVPMLLEAGWLKANAADLAVGVSCPEATRHARLAGRGWDQQTIALVDSWQWSWEKKQAGCTFVVENSGSLEDLQDHVASAARQLRALRQARPKALLAAMRQAGRA